MMERYENLGLVGEGSYGMVLKCRHKETGQLVAIKKFLESEDDRMVKKIAMREIKMLKQLQHDNLVNLIETFRRRKRLYLVFEFVDHTVLDELEKCPNGLDENTCRKILWQVLKGTEFCHLHHIIHRDIKPENILVSKTGIVKICDFGFARTLAQPGEAYTDYVATRWYRSPELLVGDTKYGRAVDIWAVGCLLSEMLTGEPLFPGDSDIDQLYHIIRCFGNLTPRHKEVFQRNPLFVGMRLPESRDIIPLEKKFTRVSTESLNLMKQCLRLDPDNRPTCSELLKHNLFTRDGFSERFSIELRQKLHQDNTSNPLLRSRVNAHRQQQSDDKNKEDAENKQQKTDSGKGVTKKKKKIDAKESKEDGKSHEDKPKRKASDSDHKSPPKNMLQSPTKSLSTTPTQKANTNSITLPPAPGGGAGVASFNHSMTPDEESSVSHRISSHHDNNVGKDSSSNNNKDPIPSLSSPAQVMGSIPPISNTLNIPGRPSIAKLNADKWSPRNVLINGNRQSSFRTSDKIVKKGSNHSKKSISVSHHHSMTVSPQGLASEKSTLHDKSSEKSHSHTKQTGSPERDYDDRPMLSLPEVKGADVSTKAKDKHALFVHKKSNVSSIPHIATLDMVSNNATHSDSPSFSNEKDFGSSGFPNV